MHLVGYGYKFAFVSGNNFYFKFQFCRHFKCVVFFLLYIYFLHFFSVLSIPGVCTTQLKLFPDLFQTGKVQISSTSGTKISVCLKKKVGEGEEGGRPKAVGWNKYLKAFTNYITKWWWRRTYNDVLLVMHSACLYYLAQVQQDATG